MPIWSVWPVCLSRIGQSVKPGQAWRRAVVAVEAVHAVSVWFVYNFESNPDLLFCLFFDSVHNKSLHVMGHRLCAVATSQQCIVLRTSLLLRSAFPLTIRLHYYRILVQYYCITTTLLIKYYYIINTFLIHPYYIPITIISHY